jgi:Protein of unknown function (DUF3800)
VIIPQPRKRAPADPNLLSDVYIDESSQTKHRFLVLGGIILPTGRVAEFERAVWDGRASDLPAGEMAWTKVSRTKLPAYKRVVDIFFQSPRDVPPIEFHSLHIDTHLLRDRVFNQGSRDVGFDKEIYQLCQKFARLHPSRLLHIYLDSRETKSSPEKLRFILNSGIRNKGDKRDWPFRRVHFRESSACQCIQVVDVLLGAVAFRLNGHRQTPTASPAKCDLSDYILRHGRVNDVLKGTNVTGIFTVWPRQLR